MSRGQLPKAYLRLDPNVDAHPEWDGIVLLMLWGNRQPRRGYFQPALVTKILGRKRAQRFTAIRPGKAKPDLILQEDGSLYLDGWTEWQEGDWTVGERVHRVRLKRNYDVTAPLPERSTPSEALRRLGVKALGTDSPPPPNGGVETPPTEPNAQDRVAVAAVFDHWRGVMKHPDAHLTAERRRRIEARLREGYSVQALTEAVDGCKASAFHMGANESGAVYDELTLICRSGSKVEEFRGRLTAVPVAAAADKNAAVAQRFIERHGGTHDSSF